MRVWCDQDQPFPNKKGKASDNVVGQIQRYMGFVKDMLAEDDQKVKGIIIALEDDVKIRRALSVAQNIEFFRLFRRKDLAVNLENPRVVVDSQNDITCHCRSSL